MKTSNRAAFKLLLAAGLPMGLASAAFAQGTVINVSGATLLENYVNQAASTNDHIDVDGDGVCGRCPVNFPPDQLAVAGVGPGFPADQFWTVQYFAVGSINGLNDLINWGDAFVTSDASGAGTDPTRLSLARVTRGYNNRSLFANAGALTGLLGNLGNPYGAPNRSDTSSLLATYDAPPTASAGGIRIDMAILDVPGRWGVRIGTPGSAPSAANLNPGDNGYGASARVSVSKTGTIAGAGLSNTLPSLTTNGRTPTITRNLFDPANPALADANTLFDTALFWAPIVPMVNYGANLRQTTVTNLQYLFGAGRAQSGENLMVVTRDSGSGTRNGWQNTIDQDPSFGVGENVGALSNAQDEDRLGSLFIPSNKNGTGNVERTVINHRLAVGYVGGERGVGTGGSPGWLVTNRADIPSVTMDIYGGAVPVRPTDSAIFNPGPNGWNLGGPAAFVTLGDPRALDAKLGGDNCSCSADFDKSGGTPDAGDIDLFFADWLAGLATADADCSGGTPDAGDIDVFFAQWLAGGCDDTNNPRINTNPAMLNSQAAAFINNIRLAIEDFTAFGPGVPQNDFSPGEWAATQFILSSSLSAIQSTTTPGLIVANPAFNAGLQAATQPLSVYVNANYSGYAVDNNGAGIAPDRRTLSAGTYTDGGTGANFVLQDATTVNDAAALSGLLARNSIAGDFNGDGLRDANDVPGLVRAVRQRQGLGAWVAPDGIYGAGAGNKASLEILGDFNGDGNLSIEDARYFADGLFLTAGQLNRTNGYTAIDNASLAAGGPLNFLGTTLATGAAYSAGASRADVNGSSGLGTPGFVVQADGTVNADDINYVYNQFKNNAAISGPSADWSNLGEAVAFDLSGDMTGDLSVSQADVCMILNILGTNAGDVNLDGATNGADLAIINSGALGRSTSTGKARWQEGDLNGDGKIDAVDVAIYNAPATLCP
jgi:hypothetical protein